MMKIVTIQKNALIACCALCLLVALPVRAEVRIIEEDLVVQMRTGDAAAVEAAREKFRALVDERLKAASAEGGEDTFDGRAIEIVVAARALRIWQSTELGIELDGVPFAPELAAEFVEKSEALDARASALMRDAPKAMKRALPSDGSQTDYGRAIEVTSRLLLDTVALTRDRVPTAKRSSLLAKARGLSASPSTFVASVSEFDTVNPDAAAYLGSGPTQSTVVSRSLSQKRVRQAIEDGEAVITPVVRAYYKALLSGDVTSARPLFDSGYWPVGLLARISEKYAGGSVIDWGPIWARKLGHHESEITVDGLTVELASGVKVTMRDQVIVKLSNGVARVVYLGSASERAQ